MFQYVDFLDIKLNQTTLIRGGTYINEAKLISHESNH